MKLISLIDIFSEIDKKKFDVVVVVVFKLKFRFIMILFIKFFFSEIEIVKFFDSNVEIVKIMDV